MPNDKTVPATGQAVCDLDDNYPDLGKPQTLKDEKYWRNRWGQIEWRLSRVNSERKIMQADIEECRRELVKLGVKP